MHYFWERSTRVVLPEGGVQLESPDGLRLGADLLVDVITSASIAFAGSSEDALFTEFRYEPQLSIGKEFRLDRAKLDLTALARYSTENDYTSYSGGGIARLALNQDNTVLGVTVVGIHDEIRASNNAGFRETLDGWTAGVTFEQVLSRTTVAVLGYQIGALKGFLGNAYRRVLRDGAPVGESPPRARTRHTAYGRLMTYVPPIDGAVHLLVRAYTDTWDMLAINPEVRFYKEFGDFVMARLRYRYYAQNDAGFFQDVYAADWPGAMTADPKLRAFQAHLLGLRVDVDTPFLDGSFLDFASDSSIYLSVDRNFTGISYGAALVGTAGGVLRF